MSLLPPLWKLTMSYLTLGEQSYVESIQCKTISNNAIHYVVQENITQWISDILAFYSLGQIVQRVSIIYDNVDSFIASMPHYQNNHQLVIQYKAKKIAQFILHCAFPIIDGYEYYKLQLLVLNVPTYTESAFNFGLTNSSPVLPHVLPPD